MRGRLIVQSKVSVPWPQSVCVWPLDQAIPPGWEELHAVRTVLSDVCACGHARGHHVGHKHQCLVLLADGGCRCARFRYPEEVEPASSDE